MNPEIVLILTMLFVFASGFVQGVTSFGFSLLAMPLLAMFLPLTDIVPFLIIVSLGVNLIVLYDVYKHIEYKAPWMWTLVASAFVGIPIGISILETCDPTILKFVLGLLVVIISLFMLFGKNFHIKGKLYNYSIIGLISGIMNGAVSFSGPPVIVFLSNLGVKKDSFRANLNFYFALANIFAIFTLYYKDMLHIEVLSHLATYSVPIVVGVLLGVYIAKRINEVLFKKIVLLALLICGVWTAASAF